MTNHSAVKKNKKKTIGLITKDSGMTKMLNITFDVCAGTDIVLGSKHKFIVNHPFGFMIETS